MAKIELKYDIVLPLNFGQVVKDYKKVLSVRTEYPAFTLSDKLEVVECKGIIENNGSWNYHNNYDDSEDELYVFIGNNKLSRWFSLNRDDVVVLQEENMKNWQHILDYEVQRLKNIAKTPLT